MSAATRIRENLESFNCSCGKSIAAETFAHPCEPNRNSIEVTMKSVLLSCLTLSVTTLFAAESAGPTLAQGQARLLRHPTYSNGRIAFSYLGDLWIAKEDGSEVRRLTDHTARDILPRFSPDGTLIAFSSNRDGNNNVYVVSASGGKPRQLTF